MIAIEGLPAISTKGEGHKAIDGRTARHAHTEELYPQEIIVATLIADGKTNTEIADTMCIAHGTARNYVSSILRKLQLPNRAAIAVYATVNDLRAAVVRNYESELVSYNPDCYRDIAFLAYA